MQRKIKSAPHIAALISLLVSVSILSAAPTTAQQTASPTTEITAQLCVDGERTPSGVIRSPVSGTVTGEPAQTLTITTSWVTSYSIYRDSDLLKTVSSVQYAADVTSSASITLPQGTSNLRLVLHGGCPETTTHSDELTLTYSSTDATVKPLETRHGSPRLTGFISNRQAVIVISINGKMYTAQNNGDGTWTLPEGSISPALNDGTYNVRVVATVDGEPISDTLTRDAIIVDTIAPMVDLLTQKSSSRSPLLAGNVDDPLASIVISINGKMYTAQNNGDGTWTLPEGSIDKLASGTYQVTIIATDRVGNYSTTTHSLEVKAPHEIGFLLSPNTGFMRVRSVNIPSTLLYGSVAAVALIGALALQTYRRNRAGDRHRP